MSAGGMAVVGSHVDTLHEQGLGHAKLPGLVSRHVDGTTTGRNWRTVLLLLEMAER